MSDVERTLAALRPELEAVPHFAGEAVLFGSVVMYLHGLRERADVGDVDLFVSPYVYGKLRTRLGWDELHPAKGDPPMLELRPVGGVPASVFSDWPKRDSWMDIRRCFTLAEDVLHRGSRWRCIPLREVLRHKETAGRLKDEGDIALLRKAILT